MNNNRQWESNRQSQQDRSDFDQRTNRYGNRYGYQQEGNKYGRADYDAPFQHGNHYGATGNRDYESDAGYTDFERSRDRSVNVGTGYDPYNYGNTVGSFNQGKGSSYTRHSDAYERNANNYNQNHQDRDWWDRATDEVASWFGDDSAERRRELDKRYGPHRGKGPKGYTRSDERIKDDLNDKLSDDSFIDASDIDVTAENGEIVLTGSVNSREEKRRAEDIAERVSGVKNVENRLRVKNREENDGATIYPQNRY